MTRDELARLQAAFGAQIVAAQPDAAALAAWVGSAPRAVAGVARYGDALRQHRLHALRLAYPVLLALAGMAWFETLAHAYGAVHPSRSADLGRFGAHLGVFLARWPAAAAHRYFADIARLEWLVHEAHGSAVRAALTLDDLRHGSPGAVDAWRLRLQRPAAVHRSCWRTAAIWLAHAAPGAPDLPPRPEGVTVALVFRAGWTVQVREIGVAEAAALAVLARGATLGEALVAARAADAGADPGALLLRWLGDGLLVRAAASHIQGHPPMPQPVLSNG